VIGLTGIQLGDRGSGMLRLRKAIEAEGGLLAQAVGPLGWTMEYREEPGMVVAAGPRAAAEAAEYQLVVDLIREGHLLHGNGRGWVVASDDPDLALLLGDQLYALGLNRLARLGDVEAVAELADVIALCAQARVADWGELTGAAWDAGPVAVGWGGSPELEAAKAAARAGDPEAPERMRQVARELAQPR
jgi:hypothetical protein